MKVLITICVMALMIPVFVVMFALYAIFGDRVWPTGKHHSCHDQWI